MWAIAKPKAVKIEATRFCVFIKCESRLTVCSDSK